jgi:hypothetical protein
MTRLPKWMLVALAVALVLTLASPVLAVSKVKDIANDGSTITLTHDGKDTTYMVNDQTKILLQSGKEGKVTDLKKDQEVSIVYRKEGDKFTALGILDRQGAFANAELAMGDVKEVSADNNRMVLRDANGKEWTYEFGPKSQIHLNDKEVKLGELKAGDKPFIVYEKSGDKFMVLGLFCNRR